MAVTKAITKCVPFVNSNNKVDQWDITMKYENDSEGDATYYTSNYNVTVKQSENGFTLKAKSSWTNAQLVALCPVSQWDTVFASQVDSVITNPPAVSTPDNDFNVPS
tara:strand:- start:4586 stop:4906 length:321 start_codon:yes stop_codon:yes gene_type:complete